MSAEQRVVRDDNDHEWWVEYKQDDKGRWQVRLMRQWSRFTPKVVRSARRKTEAKARALGDRWLDKLADYHEGWDS